MNHFNSAWQQDDLFAEVIENWARTSMRVEVNY